MSEKLIKSRERVRDFGEVFTPLHIVKQMLDLIPHDGTTIDSTYLDPACGNGNFLAEILRRKLALCKTEKDGVLAVSSVYGIDIQQDNVEECKLRLYDLYAERFGENWLVALILEANIICGDTLTGKRADGSPIEFRAWMDDWRDAVFDKEAVV
ncbi:MAG: N-6 DNA methylase [Oscillospiraceae bacterium]|nr:N-6 DNA methylase [Oscillospiraceae bacterium]